MDTKAAFEKWWESFHEAKPRERWDFLYVPEHDCYADEGIDWQYDSWKASREAIEIELPTEKTYRRDTSPILRAQNCGYNDAVADCGRTITSHGIRIKGKTE